MTPSHYLNQCWLISSEVLRHSHEGRFAGNAQYVYVPYEFEKYYIKITATHIQGSNEFESAIEIFTTWMAIIADQNVADGKTVMTYVQWYGKSN